MHQAMKPGLLFLGIFIYSARIVSPFNIYASFTEEPKLQKEKEL